MRYLPRPALLGPFVIALLVALPSAGFAGEPIVVDRYDEADSSGWPAASIGGPYTVDAEQAAFSVDGSRARIRLESPGASAYGTLDEAVALSTDLRFRFTADAQPTGYGQSAMAVLRRVDASGQYRLRVRLLDDGRVMLRAYAVAGAVSDGLGAEIQVPGVRFVPGRWIRVRAQVTGKYPTVIRAKAWDAAGSQPDTWTYRASDRRSGLQSAGSSGLGARLSRISSSAPVLFRFDDLVVERIPSPSPAPSGGTIPGIDERPYTDDSVWNTPVRDGAAYDPHSTDMVATIVQSHTGQLSSDPTQYTYPVYVATAETPRHTITTINRSRRYETDGSSTLLGTSVPNVPIDPSWGPSAGTDAQIIIVDPSTGDEYDVWGYAGAGSFAANRVSHYVAGTLRDGQPADYASRGAGLPYLAGLIRPWEIAQGHIDHALAFAYPTPAQWHCVYPATKSDGTSTISMAIPEGARLQLDPSLTEADFDRWGLDRTGRIIARAMQRYGMILVNVAGRPKIYAEDVAANPAAALTWAEVGGLGSSTVTPIPPTALRVLDLPDGYWSHASDAPMSGNCYR